MQSPSGKQHLPGNSLRRLFDRIISFHTATIKIAFAGPTAGSATPKHQSTHPLSTGNRGARTFSSVGRPSAPTAFQRLADSSSTSEPFPRQFRQIGLYHPVPKSRASPARPVSGKQRYPANGLHTEPFSLRTTRARKHPECPEREPDGSDKYALLRPLSLRTPTPKRPAHATGRRTDCLRPHIRPRRHAKSAFHPK